MEKQEKTEEDETPKTFSGTSIPLTAGKEYQTTYRLKWLCANAKDIEEMISILRGAAIELEELRDQGVTLRNDGSQQDDYAHLVTNDLEVARKYAEMGWCWWDEENEIFEFEDLNPGDLDQD